MDLAIGDVHTPSSVSVTQPTLPARKLGEPEPTPMSITAAKRKSLPEGSFAMPAQRKYPLDTAARTRNAAARLEQAKKRGSVSESEYKSARARIGRAAKKFGIESEYNASEPKAGAPKKPAGQGGGSIHIRADLAHGGAIHVRHQMRERSFYDVEGVLLTDADSASDEPVWIQIAKQGAFAGHSAGPFKMDLRTFGEIITNFKATINRAIPVDYEHASEMDATSGSIPTNGAPAQGWIRDLKIENGNLYGLVEWGQQARDQIRAGQYKFLSPAIRFDSKDRVTGKPIGARCTSCALTNVPFLDGMEPLAAKDALSPDATTMAAKKGLDQLVHSPHHYMPAIKAALKLPELCTAQECAEHLDRLHDMCMSVGPTGVHQGVNLSEYTSPLHQLVGAAPGATWTDVFDTVQDLIDAAIEQHVIEDHGGQANATDRAITNDDDSTGDIDMSDQAAAVALRDAQTKATTLEAEKATLLTEKAALATQLKDATDKATAAESRAVAAEAVLKTVTLKDGETPEAAIKRIVAENATLLTEKTNREQADLIADVDIAFATYKDVKKLSDADKVHMLDFAKSNRKAFNGMYPPVAPDQRHLLRTAPPEPRPGPDGEELSFTALTRKLMTEKGMSYGDASIEAAKMLKDKGQK